ERQLLPNDTAVVVELWDTTGRTIVSAGRDRRGQPAPTGDRGALQLDAEQHEIPGHPDSISMSPLYVEEDAHPHFWVVAPVRESGQRVAVLAREYRIAEGARSDEAIRTLIGEGVGAYYRSADGAVWSTIGGDVRSAPALRDTADGVQLVTRPDVGRMLSVSAPMAGTPLDIVIEMPERTVTAGARAAVTRLALASAVLAILGVAGAWAISRRITRPLASLTMASESIARGDYETRVPPAGDEELVRLARSFNRMAEEVSASRAELELRASEAQATAVDLDRARREAEAASRAKSEFLAVMSHELRTPLNAIAGYTELLTMGLRGPLNDAQRRDLDRIRASQEHLLGLISAVLDLSRIEAGRVSYDLQSIPLDSFLAGLDALVAPQAAAKSLTLEHRVADPTLGARADREKLRQIMLNLLSNAIRYTPAGGRVIVAAEPRGDQVAITVRDTGAGIPPGQLETIFEPFVQLDRSLTNVREGVGLGLAISRDLARGMGGDLSAESVPGKGSTFIVTLPRCVVPADAPQSTSGEVTAAERRGR
ncbi:MAG TPA: ATP-binding protein, partial [Gemmatimonadaceae bacterium]|nr:ATP-binding protein [Gemmatimonadaceae bacterium]